MKFKKPMLLYDMSNYVKEFEEIFTSKIKREGSDKLLDYLKSADFFTAPASTRFHGNYAGGLVEHTVKVYRRFLKLAEAEFGKEYLEREGESLAIIALLHDICKVNYYKVEQRNVKVDGQWVQKPYFTTDDQLPYGHGEKSVYMISGFLRLTREEAMAINWHMGAFDDRARGTTGTINRAFNMYPISLIFHVADMMTSYLDEETRT